MLKLERRPYGPESTADEVDAIRARVHQEKGDIFILHEMPVISEFSIDLQFRQLLECTSKLPYFYVLIDLTESKPPNARQRALLKRKYGSIRDQIAHAAFFTEKNHLITAAVKFVSAGIGFNSHSVHRTRPQALQAIDNARRV